MNYKKLIGFGLLMWMIMFVVVSALMAVGLAEFSYLWIITTIIAGIVGFILAKFAKPKNIGFGAVYGLCWVAIGVILDYLVTRYFAPDILGDWTLWVGYGLFFIGVILGSLGKKAMPATVAKPEEDSLATP